MARGRKVETQEETLGQEPSRNISELGGHAVERMSENDVITNEALELEKFMNEMVTIMVHDDPVEGALPVITICVNGKNQNIIRMQEQKVRRKYVEALARCRSTTYNQRVPNPAEPANIQMDPKTVLTYPFQLVRDDNPRGREWLKGILAQAV